MDTNCLRDGHKTTDVDVKVVDVLEAAILEAERDDCRREGEGRWDRAAFFEEISRAKADLDGLELEGVWRKDFKVWSERNAKVMRGLGKGDRKLRLGISSVVKPLEWMVGKLRGGSATEECGGARDVNVVGEWDKASEEFMREQGLDIWAVTTVYSAAEEEGGEESFCRQLAVQWKGAEAGEAVQGFVKEDGVELGLSEVRIEGTESRSEDHRAEGRRVWRQGNVSCSRKQVGPMMRRAMKGAEKGKR